MACHAPGELGSLGTLFLESKRHFLDYAEMTDEESTYLGHVLRRIYHVLRHITEAERIYQLSTMEGQPHFHCWIVPRRREVDERGLKFLGRDDSCSAGEASALVEKLREALKR
jgi:diadenosine tetraphosphate (Ap4A) HIT family hydrolase